MNLRARAIYAEDPRLWLAAHDLWAGVHIYDDGAKEYIARSGHYLGKPPPGALVMVSLEALVPGLFGPVPSGQLLGSCLFGRPNARNLPQDGTWAEITRFVLSRPAPEDTASHLIRVAVEIYAKRSTADRIISYHDRSRHSGCIYRKAGFRKYGVTRADGRRGSWSSRPGREQATSSEVESKRRWRLDVDDVRAGMSERSRTVLGDARDRDAEETPAADRDDDEGGRGHRGDLGAPEQDAGLELWHQRAEVPDR